MNISEELERLSQLRQSGVLSEDEFAQAKARVLSGQGAAAGAGAASAPDMINQLRRSHSDRWIGGVCGGLAQATSMPAWLWRLLFVAMTLCVGGGVLIYLLLWIFVPQD